MAYRIVVSALVRHQIGDLPGHVKAQAKREIALLSLDPRPSRCKELAGHPGYYRRWLGSDHRLVWSVDDEDRCVVIHYAGPKPPDLYDRLGLARPLGPDS